MDSMALPSSRTVKLGENGTMLHIVIRRLANGVDRVKLIEHVERAAGPPCASSVPVDERIRDLIALGVARSRIEPPADADECVKSWRDGERLHLLIGWRPAPRKAA